MTGSIPSNLHEGSRSEILADYLFSAWGAVTPVRRQDDHGVDLYGGLAQRVGQRSMITDYYVVQVKSSKQPWVFEGVESVKWLIDYPVPIFLACIDKSLGTLAVYHVTSRFLISAIGTVPDHLELCPEDTDDGCFVEWADGVRFSLSAPILRVGLEDLIDDERMAELRSVFAHWVRVDRENIDLLRYGLHRLRMPTPYRVNEVPAIGIGETGNVAPSDDLLRRGILTLAEGLECIGGQLGWREDRVAALMSALLLDHLQGHYASVFENQPRWRHRVPGVLGNQVCTALNEAFQIDTYRYAGLDALRDQFLQLPNVATFTGGQRATQPAAAAGGGDV